ncbi:transcription-repair coupling factor [Acutalibacter sp. 1XD8-33]|uniref:transcription-repair coupling factor n=1 Tax=Acutalibacter sp. 1XD8-33 TaxID=2320081 RepID=UPI000EA27859|nr:transcription-repair coupling factor [Acutalibacter sp. 1XD8-33]RKJ41126.1 transcription-repair coupling factor [Acutalibacter sp. 1XD8-33]
MKSIFSALSRSPGYRELSGALASGAVPAVATGLSGVHKCAAIAALCRDSGRRALILAADEAESQRFFEDLSSLGLSPVQFPLRDMNFRDTAVSSREYERLRLEALSRLENGSCGCVIACMDAALQFTMGPKDLKRRLFSLKAGQSLSIESLLEALVGCGYVREDQIEGPGQFSRRGGIVDFFSPSAQQPVRVEFWGDEVDSLSAFDPATQRRTDPVDAVTLAPCVEVLPGNVPALVKKIEALAKSLRGKRAPKAREVLLAEAEKLREGLHIGSMDKFLPLVYEAPATLFDYFPPESSLLVFSEGTKLKERVRTTLAQWSQDLPAYLEEGLLCKGLDQYAETWEYALTQAQRIPTVFLDVFARGSYEIPTKTLVNLTVRQFPAWGGGVQLLEEDLAALLKQGRACVVLSGTERAGRALADDLKQSGLPASYIENPSTAQKGTVTVTAGSLSAGFDWPDAGFSLITRGRLVQQKPRKSKKDKSSKEISSLSELSPGDYVVHASHGVGVFQGIHKLEMNGVVKDYIKVAYAKNDTLYVPVTQLDMVSKYIGPREDSGVRLNRLGGADWQRQKARVRAAVKDIAKELIQLYAQRMQQKGHPFPPDGEWQRDFEARFEFDETEDQLRCVSEIKDDMERDVPMDRLLCGDVGFGKTEVALRAAFKCVTAGKQCAILVPTTILAWQHYQTILKRMEGFPVDVEVLSRFRTPKQQEAILKKLKRGSMDIIVGTHRLVSKDVAFKDLGLVIIDEEQRFGVAQKERLKALCKSADVLTLSATPIPRTLNMALSGIRDMSVIEEAPQDRHPVQTYVVEHDKGLIYDAIRRELRRGGQVYYLHNDTASISRVAAQLQQDIPEARVGFGHGKMDEEELSEVWRQLLDHEIDILVCTTIIETGVDVPTANTLIIENADRMGLSQLHQLRGRVGRSNRRAYAYLTYTPNKSLAEIAQKRLSAIREFTEFGSGFKIALRDLEIRGAGNVLGGEQHGHMEAVGYDMYVKLLSEAVSLMKGEAPQKPVDEGCLVDMQVPAHIPENYIDSVNLRLDVYRRIAEVRNEEDALDVTDELIDRFGEPPEAVKGLIDIALLRNAASDLGVSEIKQQGDSLLLYKNQLDMDQVGRLVKAMNGRVLVSAGSRPYLSLRLQGQPPLEALSEALKVMGEDVD